MDEERLRELFEASVAGTEPAARSTNELLRSCRASRRRMVTARAAAGVTVAAAVAATAPALLNARSPSSGGGTPAASNPSVTTTASSGPPTLYPPTDKDIADRLDQAVRTVVPDADELTSYEGWRYFSFEHWWRNLYQYSPVDGSRVLNISLIRPARLTEVFTDPCSTEVAGLRVAHDCSLVPMDDGSRILTYTEDVDNALVLVPSPPGQYTNFVASNIRPDGLVVSASVMVKGADAPPESAPLTVDQLVDIATDPAFTFGP